MSDAARTPGWGRVLALALVCLLLSVFHPALLITVPLALLLLGFPWRRPLVVAGGLVLMWASLWGGAGPLADVERGWALLVSAWFLLAVIALPQRGFLARGLAAVSAAAVTAAVLLATRQGAFAWLDQVVAQQLRMNAQRALLSFRPPPALEGIVREANGVILRMADVQSALFPALLALASLAGLGVAWWAYGQLARREGAALAPLREFRFPDALVWVLVAGLAMLVLPVDDLAARAGTNLLAFMAALYAVRGAAVLLVVGGAPGPVGAVLVGLLLVLLYPLVMAAAVLVGLTDTWLDLRTSRDTGAEP